MKKKVGIPRALLYYEYFPLWKSFFEELGAEVVLSEKTSKKILDEGVRWCVDEACMPVKLFHGHVLNLKDRVDFLFIPRLTSMAEGEYICPKFGGLPDMIRHTLKDLPVVIDTEFNMRKNDRQLFDAMRAAGSFLTRDSRVIDRACRNGMEQYEKFRQQSCRGIFPVDLLESQHTLRIEPEKDRLTIAVMGHVYNVYDSYSNMRIHDKLAGDNINVITAEMVDEKLVNQKAATLPKKLFWTFGRRVLGAAFQLVEENKIDGMIYIMSFGCGVDAFMGDLIERKVRKSSNIPFITLTLDEHSGEAGMNTRIEAFIDMINWRKRNESNLSAHG